jgi:hypothetical protein
MKEEKIKKSSNMKVKGKHPRGRLRSRWEQQVRKDVTMKEENRKKLRRRRTCRKTDAEAWL